MATGRQLKALFRPLLKRRPDLAFESRALFYVPLRHYFRGVFFAEGLHTRILTAFPIVLQLFAGGTGLHAGRNFKRRVEVANENLGNPEVAADFVRRIEHESLPPLEPICDPASHQARPDFFQGDPRHDDYAWRKTMALDHCFTGDFDSAERELAQNVADVPQFSPDLVTEEHRLENSHWKMAYLLKVLRTDRSRVPMLLHEWEAQMVHASKLTKYWQPSPFPCER